MAPSFRCAPCDQSIPTAEALADHVRSVHGIDVGAEPTDAPAAPVAPGDRAEPVERLGRGTPEPDVAELRKRARSHGDTVDLLGTAVLWIGLGGALALAIEDGAGFAYAAATALSAVVTWALLKAAAILVLLAGADDQAAEPGSATGDPAPT